MYVFTSRFLTFNVNMLCWLQFVTKNTDSKRITLSLILKRIFGLLFILEHQWFVKVSIFISKKFPLCSFDFFLCRLQAPKHIFTCSLDFILWCLPISNTSCSLVFLLWRLPISKTYFLYLVRPSSLSSVNVKGLFPLFLSTSFFVVYQIQRCLFSWLFDFLLCRLPASVLFPFVL